MSMNDESPNPYQSPKSIEAPPSFGGAQNDDKLVVLAAFDNPIDAHTFKNVLEQNGIDASVNNETTTAIFGLTIAGPSSAFSIEVVIRKSDAEAGLAVKERFLSSLPNDSSPIPEWACKCGETVDAGFEVCWNCEAGYDEQHAPTTN